jgi:hypothetical protein
VYDILAADAAVAETEDGFEGGTCSGGSLNIDPLQLLLMGKDPKTYSGLFATLKIPWTPRYFPDEWSALGVQFSAMPCRCRSNPAGQRGREVEEPLASPNDAARLWKALACSEGAAWAPVGRIG